MSSHSGPVVVVAGGRSERHRLRRRQHPGTWARSDVSRLISAAPVIQALSSASVPGARRCHSRRSCLVVWGEGDLE